MIVVGLVVVGTVLLLMWGRLQPAVVALLALATLLLTGTIGPEAGLSGFSNAATVTVAGMFVLSAALERTGLVDRAGEWLGGVLGRSYAGGWALLMLGAAVGSAFVNNTTVVAILIPVLLKAGRDTGISPSRLLLPVSFSAMFGGMCTLVGTSTNLVVSSMAQGSGLAPFGFFELAPVGLAFVVVGLGYLAAVQRWLPERRAGGGDVESGFELGAWITDLELASDSVNIGRSGSSGSVLEGLDRDVVDVYRDGERLPGSLDSVDLQRGDVLRVRADAGELARLATEEGLVVCSSGPRELESEEHVLVEGVVLPESWAVGQPLSAVADRFDAVLLALRQRGELDHRSLGDVALQAGDAVLLRVPAAGVRAVRENPGLLVVTEHGDDHRPEKIPVVLGVLAAIVLSASLGLLAIEVAVVAGVVALLLTRCLTLDEAVAGIQWNVVVLLAGLLALGEALQHTGADGALADALLAGFGDFGPHAVLGALYVVTVLMTSAMSNNAAAAVITPVAITAADQLGVDSRALLMAVAYGASASFLTPVGYQTNTMIYGVGGYRFTDFTRIGGPLNLVFAVLAVVLLPVAFPFGGSGG